MKRQLEILDASIHKINKEHDLELQLFKEEAEEVIRSVSIKPSSSPHTSSRLHVLIQTEPLSEEEENASHKLTKTTQQLEASEIYVDELENEIELLRAKATELAQKLLDERSVSKQLQAEVNQLRQEKAEIEEDNRQLEARTYAAESRYDSRNQCQSVEYDNESITEISGMSQLLSPPRGTLFSGRCSLGHSLGLSKSSPVHQQLQSPSNLNIPHATGASHRSKSADRVIPANNGLGIIAKNNNNVVVNNSETHQPTVYITTTTTNSNSPFQSLGNDEKELRKQRRETKLAILRAQRNQQSNGELTARSATQSSCVSGDSTYFINLHQSQQPNIQNEIHTTAIRPDGVSRLDLQFKALGQSAAANQQYIHTISDGKNANSTHQDGGGTTRSIPRSDLSNRSNRSNRAALQQSRVKRRAAAKRIVGLNVSALKGTSGDGGNFFGWLNGFVGVDENKEEQRKNVGEANFMNTSRDVSSRTSQDAWKTPLSSRPVSSARGNAADKALRALANTRRAQIEVEESSSEESSESDSSYH